MAELDMNWSNRSFLQLGISEEVTKFGNNILNGLKDEFDYIDKIAEYNHIKVLAAFQKNRVNEACLNGTTGYGYNDFGRDTLEKVYADVFHTEDALVRAQITCGTHAIALALFSNLRPGDELLSVTGKPYDTLDEVIGLRESKGSLKEYGITYAQADLKADGTIDFDLIGEKINDRTKMITIQRSKGYKARPTLSVEQIGEIIRFVKNRNQNIICMVDNCYGEFTEIIEPTDVGADIMAGSLIKNPGGGLAPIGGYIVGKNNFIEQAAARLTAPGLGKEVGASLQVLRSFYQGFFLAPTVTAAAVKTAMFGGSMFETLNFKVLPPGKELRHDIIQAIDLGSKEGLLAFCRGIQAASPVDSYVTPEPWDMPGYEDEVIMAAGAFISGSSIELSADGPLREPYTAFFQGGLTWEHGKTGMLLALQFLINDGVIKLETLKV